MRALVSRRRLLRIDAALRRLARVTRRPCSSPEDAAEERLPAEPLGRSALAVANERSASKAARRNAGLCFATAVDASAATRLQVHTDRGPVDACQDVACSTTRLAN